MVFGYESNYTKPALRSPADWPEVPPGFDRDGNLTYLQFIDLVKHLWEGAHPDIPIYPRQGSQQAHYPCIVYALEVRKVHDREPKPRFREYLEDGPDAVQMMGQRFQNVVLFSVVTEAGESASRYAEEIIEVFEDFMLEMMSYGVFKELGLSEIVYARRLSDREENRAGADTNVRTVAFLVTTEKVRSTQVDRLKRIVIDGRIFLGQGSPYFESAAGEGGTTTQLYYYGRAWKTGDKVRIEPVDDHPIPSGLDDGVVYEVVWVGDGTYSLHLGDLEYIEFGPGQGSFIFVPDVDIVMTDEFSTDVSEGV